MSSVETEARVAAVRRFNRFFTRKIGVLNEGLLDTPWSLTEVRVMYELAHRDEPTAGELCQLLGLDAGYLSRILRRFDREKLIRRRKSRSDARRSHLALTSQGRKVFADLDRRSHDDVAKLLETLPEDGQQQLIAAMAGIETILGEDRQSNAPCLLRPHRSGDMGWVIWAHTLVYQREYGWNDRFIALVARVVADFSDNFDPHHERCWIAERDGCNIGSVFLVRETDELARLRLLLVTPEARGSGIGRRLVEECVAAAREMGYRRMTLWTNDVLHAARHIYEDCGFRLVREKRHGDHGPELVGQDWELDLREA